MKRLQLGCDLWSINRWLRYSGWRLFVQVDESCLLPTRIGFIWYGWKNLKKDDDNA